jgi:hypothetical protein
MGNQIEIVPTTFTDGDGDEKYGARVSDNVQATYSDNWDEVPAEDMEVLRRVLQDDNPQMIEIVHLTVEHESNVYIGENFYKWEEVSEVFEEILQLG